MGAHIRGVGTNVITIDGVDELSGCFHEIIPDRIEAATYIVLAAAAAEDVMIENIIPQHLESLLSKLHEIGIQMDVGVDSVHVKGHDGNIKATDIIGKVSICGTDKEMMDKALELSLIHILTIATKAKNILSM